MTTLDAAAGGLPRGRRLPHRLAGLMFVLAALAPIWGVVYDINGATQAHAWVHVPVAVRAVDGLRLTVSDRPITSAQADGAAPAGPATTVTLRQYQGPDDPGHSLHLVVPGAPDGTAARADLSQVTLDSWNSTVPEQILARGGVAVICVCVGVGALVLNRILLSIADGRPFDRGHPRRFTVLAGTVAVGGVLPGFLTTAAGDLVLHRVGLTGPQSPVTAVPAPGLSSLLPCLLLCLLVLSLAEAFRRGGELARAVDGLT